MANMGYCRFQNTLEFLKDCYEHMQDSLIGDEEEQAREAMFLLCEQIIDEFGTKTARDYFKQQED